MNTLQTESVKIKKRVRNTQGGERNYSCGGCKKAYKSYPALYLHIRRKHKGKVPIGTNTNKSLVLAPEQRIPTGRPPKCMSFYDAADQEYIDLETTENDLFGFMGDELDAICSLSIKPTMQTVVAMIDSICKLSKDEYLCQINQKVQELYSEVKKDVPEGQDVQLEYESVKETGPKETVMILAWFILWLGRDIIKSNFISDLTIIFSRIWKIISQKNWYVTDLADEIVSSEIYTECQYIVANLLYFRQKNYLLADFVRKLCRFIGDTFK